MKDRLMKMTGLGLLLLAVAVILAGSLYCGANAPAAGLAGLAALGMITRACHSPINLAPASGEDHTAKEGYFVESDGALVTDNTTTPWAVIVRPPNEEGEDDDVALPNSGQPVQGMLHSSPGTVNYGTKLVFHTNGLLKALPASAGTYICVGYALETGVASKLCEFRFVEPYSITVS